jgi:putative transposase
MARIARIVIPNLPHHVTHRGNERRILFHDETDRSFYLRIARKFTRRHAVRVWNYCLMTNHVHFLLVPEASHSLSKLLHALQMTYALWYHARHGGTGHLWGHRFFSTPADWAKSLAAARYIEMNPVRAGMVPRAEDHPWSSARAHCAGRNDHLLDPMRPLPRLIHDWRAWLLEANSPGEDDLIRTATRTGRPLGGPEFVRELEARTGRVLAPRRRGRKPASTSTIRPPVRTKNEKVSPNSGLSKLSPKCR